MAMYKNDKYNAAVLFISEENDRRFNDLLIRSGAGNVVNFPFVQSALWRAKACCKLIEEDTDVFAEGVRQEAVNRAQSMQAAFDQFYPEAQRPHAGLTILRSVMKEAEWGLIRQDLTLERAREILASCQNPILDFGFWGFLSQEEWTDSQTCKDCEVLIAALGKYINSLEDSSKGLENIELYPLCEKFVNRISALIPELEALQIPQTPEGHDSPTEAADHSA